RRRRTAATSAWRAVLCVSGHTSRGRRFKAIWTPASASRPRSLALPKRAAFAYSASRKRLAVQEHSQLLDAIVVPDGGRAQDMMPRHVTGFEAAVRRVL